MKKLLTVLLLIQLAFSASAQEFDSSTLLILDYEKPTRFELGGIAVKGNNFTDRNIIVVMSGLTIGQQIIIPGDELRIATENLWKEGLFSDIEIKLAGTKGTKLFIDIVVTERPRLSKFSIKGLRKSETNDVRDAIGLRRNQIITEDLINQTRHEIEDYFYEKGYYGITTEFTKELDTEKPNFEILRIKINKGKKIKVQDIVFIGNDNIESKKLRSLIKPKRKYKKINIFASSKYIEETYEETKPQILLKYNSLGYRDARIVYDSVKREGDNRVNIEIKIDEGTKYYFRNITWVGNTKYRSSLLDTILGIKKGDIYDLTKLNTRVMMNPNGFDVSSLYMDDGYLFFNVNPVEVLVENDSIDIELRIYEGKQAVVNRVTVVGNDKTSDFVALRVIRTLPGDKFSRTDIQRSLRELAALGFFDPEALDVIPKPNPANGTVDIEYHVQEKPSDQIEASGGWGGFGGFVGTLGLTLNNFSTRKMLQKGGWNPIPTGDGQKVSLRAQSNGPQYQGYSLSFLEPWLGGNKPNSLSVSFFHSVQSTFSQESERPKFKTTGGSVAFGKRLKVPDDYFTFNLTLSYQKYSLKDWGFNGQQLGFSTGSANLLSLTGLWSRNSTNHPIYPSSGSKFSFSIQSTLPYSAFNKEKDYQILTPEERFKWIELHKEKFEAQWFIGLSRKSKKREFVLAPAIRYGAVGLFNKDLGYSPFEQFRVGGSGLSNFVLYGTDIVAQRGYADGSISSEVGESGQGVMPFYTKYTLELRYPLTVGQSSTIFAQAFLESGNAFRSFQEFNPFDVRHAGGIGVRMFLPMFGLLGLDYGWPIGVQGPGQFHFLIGQQF